MARGAPKRSSQKKSISGLNQASEQLILTIRIHPKGQINGWREIADSEVAPRLAQTDRAHIVCREE
jgi:hypothetical protein